MTNTIKTFLLLGILSVMLITIGGLIGGRNGVYTAFFFSLFMNGIAYFFSDKIALSMSQAKPLNRQKAPEIYKMVEELTHQMKIPMPKLYLTPDVQANAFATGRDPAHASVAVTQGILEILTKEELRGVIAHELAHVKNRDVLIATVAAVIASSISFLSNMTLYGGYRSDEEDNRGNAALGLLVAILVPIAASIIQMAVSRQREYGADETGAKTVRSGEPLANALLKIHNSVKMSPNVNINPALSSLYIANPLGGVGGTLLNLFSTHPPVQDRVKKLRMI